MRNHHFIWLSNILSGLAPAQIVGVVTYSDTTATFTPASALTYNTQYTVVITTGVKDSSGNAMVNNHTWSFTTGSESSIPSITNSIGMKFVYIPAGTFQMGSPDSEAERDSDEIQHKVTLTNGFYLQTTEVTQGPVESCDGE